VALFKEVPHEDFAFGERRIKKTTSHSLRTGRKIGITLGNLLTPYIKKPRLIEMICQNHMTDRINY
jgi:hypothetical protein